MNTKTTTNKGTSTATKTTKKKAAAPANINTIASDALTTLTQLVNSFPADNVTQSSTKVALTGGLVSPQLMALAVSVLEQDPALFPGYDAGSITAGAQYVQAVTPVIAVLQQFTKTLSSGMRQQRGNAATQTLAVYASLRARSKLTLSPQLSTLLGEMAVLLRRKPKDQATAVTQTDMAKAAKVVKAVKKATKNAAQVAQSLALSNASTAEVSLLTGTATPPPLVVTASPPTGPLTTAASAVAASAAVTPR